MKTMLTLMSLLLFIPLTFSGISGGENIIFFLKFPYFFMWLGCFAWISHVTLNNLPVRQRVMND